MAMPERTDHILEPLLDRQRQSWLSGSRPPVEALLDGSSLRDDTEAQLDLVYNEIVLREELGEEPTVEEYIRRYPHLREELEIHFEVHRAIHDPLLIKTARLVDMDTQTDDPAHIRDAWPEPPDYEILQLLGEGGMGVVYKARHRRLRRIVALKMFRPGRQPTQREVLRFQTEAEAIARLHHPNIVQIFEIGSWNGLPYLALELAEHGTLAHKLQQLPFAPRAAAELIETLARAAHHAHQQNIIHRDLKPANVLFTADGTPKITDFGLAKVSQEENMPRDATRTGEPIGTPRYMSPEQATGQTDGIGPATDVHALGMLLYECLTGRAPFVAASVVETLEKIRSEEPLAPRRLQPSTPRDLETICLHCLQKEPARRYATAGELADDLRRFLNREPIMARPTPIWERVWKWCRRRPTHAALLGIVLLLILSGITATVIRDRMERQRVAQKRDKVEARMLEGQEALQRGDGELAAEKFREAWVEVQGEPALRDYHLSVSGWLDHSHRAVSDQQWKHRLPPREYDERRDEALLRGLLLDPQSEHPVREARNAVAGALEFTLPTDPAWRVEREQLTLLDAALIHVDAGAQQALARLSTAEDFSSRLFHTRKAVYLEQLGRKDEAHAERSRAEQFPPNETANRFVEGMDHARCREFAAAIRDFEAVLDADPEHFMARLFLAICFLHQDRPAEAKVALTACIAQRPRFAWSYLLRGRCIEKLGDPVAAKRDFQRAAELQPDIPNR
jgi:serine/threonine protein kinase/tetratricopeptide (TPR) repeat protein